MITLFTTLGCSSKTWVQIFPLDLSRGVDMPKIACLLSLSQEVAVGSFDYGVDLFR